MTAPRSALDTAKPKGVVTVDTPSGIRGNFRRVLVDGKPCGMYEVVATGFVPTGCRKVRKHEAEAHLDLIRGKIKSLLKELSPLMDALNNYA